MNNETSIRWLISRDRPEVLRIENASFENPWDEQDFMRVLRQRSCIGMVAVRDDLIVGYVIYEMRKTSLHLLNIAVDRLDRRGGTGRMLLDKVAGKLSQQRRRRLTMHVRESNLDGLLFLKACGFRAINVLKGIYQQTDDDAIVMQLHVNALECSGV